MKTALCETLVTAAVITPCARTKRLSFQIRALTVDSVFAAFRRLIRASADNLEAAFLCRTATLFMGPSTPRRSSIGPHQKQDEIVFN
jgi:hypothetical protein